MITGTVVETGENIGTASPLERMLAQPIDSLGPRMCPIRRSLRRLAPLPESARRPDEDADLPKQPRRSQRPDVDVFLFVAAPEIGMPKRARLVKPAVAVEAATRLDEHRDPANHPDANRSEVFSSPSV